MTPTGIFVRTFHALPLLALCLAATLRPAVAQEQLYRIDTVVLSGESLPGTDGAGLAQVSDHDLDNSGDLMFGGSWWSSALGQNQSGLWLWRQGNVIPVAVGGEAVPGGAGEVFDPPITYVASVNPAGDVAFMTRSTDGTVDDDSLFVGTPDNLRLFARTGEPAPGAGGLLFESLHFGRFATFLQSRGPALNSAGEAAFMADLTACLGCGLPGSVDQGLWSTTAAGGLELLALTGDPAPGTAASAFARFMSYSLNDAGQLAFLALLDDASSLDNEGIWTGTPGALSLVAKTGDEAPGAAGLSFTFFGAEETFGPALNANGDVFFRAFLNSDDWAINSGLWLARDGIIELVARAGAPAPGTSDAVFDLFWLTQINASGTIAFFSGLSNGIRSIGDGIWLGTAASPTLLVRSGDAAPGTTGRNFSQIFDMVLNAAGEVVFQAQLNSSGFDLGVWAGDFNDISPVVLPGQVLEVRPGDLRTVRFAHILANFSREGAGITSFNDAGQVMFNADFEDGSRGVFLATPVDPGSNQPPLADAGPDQSVQTLETVALDGSGSVDPEGEALAYAWSLDGVEIATGPTPTVGPFAAGTLTVTLTVTDPLGEIASDIMTLVVANRPPLANAGPDQTVQSQQTATLDGSGSSDPEGEALTYAWSLDGIEIAIGPAPTVGPFAVGPHTITLTVTDLTGAIASDTMVLTVANASPLANAGPDQTVQGPQVVTLDGTGSSDPDGDALIFAWSLGGQQIATGATATVGPFSPGIYTIVLTVDDGRGATATDSLVLTVTNTSPVANAGPDQSVQGPQLVALDGSGSSDPDGDALTFAWSLGGQQIASGATATVGPFSPGIYTVTLTVTDPAGATASDGMTLTVLNTPPVADAGPDLTVLTLDTVVLDGSGSSDPEGDALTHVWSLNGTQIATGPTPTVGPFASGSHTIILTVTDPQGASASDSLVITSEDQPVSTPVTLSVVNLFDNKNGKNYFAGGPDGTDPLDDINSLAEEDKLEVLGDDSSFWWEAQYADPDPALGDPSEVIVTLNYRPEQDWSGTFTVEYRVGGSVLASITLPGNSAGDDESIVWDLSSVVTSSGDLANGRLRFLNSDPDNGKKVFVSFSSTSATLGGGGV